jgi:hypothetical protein
MGAGMDEAVAATRDDLDSEYRLLDELRRAVTV